MSAAQPYLHAIDPFALKITENFGIRWYGLSYLAGFAAGYFIVRWMGSRKLSPLPVEKAADFVFTIALGTIIGGRLGYCIFYSPELLTQFGATFPFWGVLAINEGGMASHGGIIGIVCAALLYGRKHKLPALHIVDLTTLGGALGIFFGRIANFINGELVGRPCSPDHAFAVKFPQDMYLWLSDAPQKLVQLSALVPNVGVSPEQWKTWLSSYHGSPSSWQAIQGTLDKIIVSIQAGNETLISGIAPLLIARHPSQLYAALLEGLLVFCAIMLVWHRARKPGVITAWFFLVYSVARIYGEQFRMPDAHLGFQLFDLTRGQWLSVALFVVGLLCLFFWSKRKVQPIGGWRKKFDARDEE